MFRTMHGGAKRFLETRCLQDVFDDADTWFEPDGLARILSGYRGRAYSVGPYHSVRKMYEDLSLFFNFTMTAGTVPVGLFGQLLLVDRESYRGGGGQFRAAGVPVRSVTGRGAFSFRTCPNGIRELTEGWTKGFASGAGQTPGGTVFLIVGWMIGLMLAPLGWLMTGDGLSWGGACLRCAAQVGWFSRKVGAFRCTSALLFPLPLVFFFGVFAWSSARSGRRVTWKGREIRAD